VFESEFRAKVVALSQYVRRTKDCILLKSFFGRQGEEKTTIGEQSNAIICVSAGCASRWVVHRAQYENLEESDAIEIQKDMVNMTEK